jgi:hypothetical protein
MKYIKMNTDGTLDVAHSKTILDESEMIYKLEQWTINIAFGDVLQAPECRPGKSWTLSYNLYDLSDDQLYLSEETIRSFPDGFLQEYPHFKRCEQQIINHFGVIGIDPSGKLCGQSQILLH